MRAPTFVLIFALGCSSTSPFDGAPEDADATAIVDVSAAPVPMSSTGAKSTVARTQPEGSTEGVVRVSKEADSEERRLVFRGVQIERQGKGPLVVSYGADDLWRDFDGQRVWVRTESYTPEGRAIGGEHARVTELWLVDESSAKRYLGFGPSKTMNGELKKVTGEKGSKSEGEATLMFVDAAGTTHQVLSSPAKNEKEHLGKVKVVARSVELSKFAAHLGMPAIWLASVEAL